MTRRLLRRTAAVCAGLLLLSYVVLLITNRENEILMTNPDVDTDRLRTVAIFGATGTIGDGLLKAAMNSPDVGKVRVITRRPSPRIEAGVASGDVEMIIHTDYRDYSAIHDQLGDVDAVFWAIGLSSAGLDRETYREIHLDYPSRFLTAWLGVSQKENVSFHYVSGAGAKQDSRMMWAREKALAESSLAQLAADSNVRVFSYRPSVILPTETEAHVGHRIGYAILRPIKAAVAAETIGQAMLGVSSRRPAYPTGTIFENKTIIDLGEAYERLRPIPEIVDR